MVPRSSLGDRPEIQNIAVLEGRGEYSALAEQWRSDAGKEEMWAR